eukprot:5708646-Pyramimonas_sp.AAC.1
MTVVSPLIWSWMERRAGPGRAPPSPAIVAAWDRESARGITRGRPPLVLRRPDSLRTWARC